MERRDLRPLFGRRASDVFGDALPNAPLQAAEQLRLEHAINWARWGGAALVFATGPQLPNIGTPFVIAAGVALLVYASAFEVAMRRVHGARGQRQLSMVAFAADAAVVATLMLIFSPDPGWMTFAYGVLVIIVGAFRSPRLGGTVAAVLMGIAYAAAVIVRASAFGFDPEPRRLIAHIGLYVLTALLMTGILRELNVLRLQRARFYDPLLRAQNDLGEGLVLIDRGRPTYWNEAFQEVAGLSRREVDALRRVESVVIDDDRERVSRALGDAAARAQPSTFETRIIRSDGTTRHVLVALQPFQVPTHGAGDRGGLVLAVVRDITASKEAGLALERAALHDELTGLANRRALMRHMNELLKENEPFALLLIQLDGLTELRATFGHPAADDLVIQAAARVVSSIPDALLTVRVQDRMGVVIAGDGAENAVAAAKALIEHIDKGFVVEEAPLHLPASVGIALAPAGGRDAAAVLRSAETAVSTVPRATTGVTVYEPGTAEAARERLQLLRELRSAIEADELRLHFQPKIDGRSGGIAGVEALVRWQHPTRGLLAPGVFLPLVIGTSLERSLSVWVLRNALSQCHTWRALGFDVPVAVNVGMLLAQDPDLCSVVLDLLTQNGVPARALEIEITEDVAMTDARQAMRAISQLAAEGVGVLIDDFGVGQTSLSYLQRLRVRGIKLDRSFVTNMLQHPSDEVIVRAALGLARNLGLLVVAEGIEDGATWERLRSLGCDEGQGYHFARPLPLNYLVAWMRAWARTGEAAVVSGRSATLTVSAGRLDH